jgi:chromate transporter
MNDLLKMFFVFLKVGAFTLGGGYAMIPLIEKEVVEKNKWVNEEEFLNIIALAQTIPGAVAINSATYIGYRIFGFIGGIVGCLGIMLPSVISILLIAIFFIQFQNTLVIQSMFKGIRPAVAVLIFIAFIKLAKPLEKKLLSLSWIACIVLLITIFHVHPILVIVGSGLLGYKLFKGNDHHGNNY